ncbi:hypothetical protein CI610_02322 [invertebrate metagenome]|uniref:Uncharacterized protein n=1 Tax=invertebrate metagenome TaxID=1711999 RepID=A0A2H9T6A0_9ZZZZ
MWHMAEKIRVLQLQNRFSPAATNLGEQIIQALPPDIYEVSSVFLKGKPDHNEEQAGHQVFFDFASKQLKGWHRWL